MEEKIHPLQRIFAAAGLNVPNLCLAALTSAKEQEFGALLLSDDAGNPFKELICLCIDGMFLIGITNEKRVRDGSLKIEPGMFISPEQLSEFFINSPFINKMPELWNEPLQEDAPMIGPLDEEGALRIMQAIFFANVSVVSGRFSEELLDPVFRQPAPGA